MRNLRSWFKIGPVLFFVFLFMTGCQKVETSYTAENEIIKIKGWLDAMSKNNNIDTTATGLYYIVNKVGTGRTVQAGDTVTVQYSGMFLDGSVFDSSSDFTYVHKATGQRLIEGWEEGIEIMSKGGSALFLIPSAKGYGNYGYAVIPPYTPLLFAIEIIDLR